MKLRSRRLSRDLLAATLMLAFLATIARRPAQLPAASSRQPTSP